MEYELSPLQKELLTSTGRLLALLYRAGGKLPLSEIRKNLSSSGTYTALLNATQLGLVKFDGQAAELTEKGREIGRQLAAV